MYDSSINLFHLPRSSSGSCSLLLSDAFRFHLFSFISIRQDRQPNINRQIRSLQNQCSELEDDMNEDAPETTAALESAKKVSRHVLVFCVVRNLLSLRIVDAHLCLRPFPLRMRRMPKKNFKVWLQHSLQSNQERNQY